MEFDFHVRGLGGESHISRWDAQTLRKLSPEDMQNLTNVVTVIGKRSAVAQGLGAPITDIWRLQSTDQRLYLYAMRRSGGTSVLGGIKMGRKKLFVRTENASLVEVEPVSVLDFYVHESCQRQGVGKQLFEHVLAAEQQAPAGMAYDRPSPKLLAFLKKYYGLQHYVPQSNNYVIYNDFWGFNTAAPLQRGRLPGMASKPNPTPQGQPAASHASVPPWLQPPPQAPRQPPPPPPPQQQQQQQHPPYPAATRSPLPGGSPYAEHAPGPGFGAGVPPAGVSDQQWQYGAGPHQPSHSPPMDDLGRGVPGLGQGYGYRPEGLPDAGPSYGPGSGMAGARRSGSGGSGYGAGWGPYAGSGAQAGGAPPPPGYVGTGLKTKITVGAPSEGEYSRQQYEGGVTGLPGLGHGGGGSRGGGEQVLGAGAGAGAGQLPGRSLQPSQSFGQRWGQSNSLATSGVGVGAPGAEPGPGVGPGGLGMSPTKGGSPYGRPPSGHSPGPAARPASGLGFAPDSYFSVPPSASLLGQAPPLPPAPAPAAGPRPHGGQDTLDSFRDQQMQQGRQYGTPGRTSGGRRGGQGTPSGQYTPSPPWATEERSSAGSRTGAGTGSGAEGVGGRPGSGAWQGTPGRPPALAIGPGAPGSGAGAAGAGSASSPSARAAGLAQRSGAGAAGCLVW